MPRISVGLQMELDLSSKIEHLLQDSDAQNNVYGLTFEMAAGMGPTEFLITPSKDFSFSLNEIIKLLAKLLDIPALANVTKVTSKEPWSLIFETRVRPSLKASFSNENKSIYLTLTIVDVEGNPAPLELGGEYDIGGGLKITVEPKFKVYNIMVGYNKKKGGMDVSAKVVFLDQKKPTDPELISTFTETGEAANAQVVKVPFPVPNQGSSTFKLKYLGLGQRFGPPLPKDPNDFSTALDTIFKDLIANMTSNNPQQVIEKMVKDYYHPDRGWFIAADVEFKGWEVRFIFNDPVLYGLEVSCSVDQFKGLSLIILYMKLGPHLGVYYGKLTIPEQYRTLNFGAVALTLPTVQIWIYTNGDFKINVGWPLGKDSIGLEIYIFTGGCGFYFGKLRSGDNPQTANPPTTYNPIIIFGLGVWFGVGRSFRKGPLSAQLSLTLQGTFQGLLAWEEGKGSTSRTPDYFWFAATVGVVGTLQGAVDLKIIKLSILVRLSVTAGIAFELDYNTLVNVTAKVEVSASVKILFIKITVSFKATISHDFILTHGGKGNASLNGPQNLSFQGFNAYEKDNLDSLIEPEPLRHLSLGSVVEAIPAFDDAIKVQLNFILYPAVVYGQEQDNGPKAIAILAMASPDPSGDTGKKTDWEQLMEAFASWLLTTYHQGSNNNEWLNVLENLNANGNNPPVDFDVKLVEGFLAKTIQLTINGEDLKSNALEENETQNKVFFPIIPNLKMEYEGGSQAVLFTNPKVSKDYLDILANQFADFSLSAIMSNNEVFQSVSFAEFLQTENVSVNDLLFVDFFLMTARQLAQQMADEAHENATPSSTIAANVAGFVSRFLLHGLDVPVSADANASNQPLYAFTQQQFPVDDSKDSTSANLTKNAGYQQETGRPDYNKLNLSIASGVATLPVKKPLGTPPEFPGIPVILPPISPNALWVAARNRLPWEAVSEAGQFVVPLPTQIQSLLNNEAVHLTVRESFPHPGLEDAGISITPALIISVKISQIKSQKEFNVNEEGTPDPDTLPFVYQLGSADDETRDKITLLLKQADLSNCVISILYNSDKNGYVSDKQNTANTFISKTNLSTSSKPDSIFTPLHLKSLLKDHSSENMGPVKAYQNNLSDFLRLVWEKSVVNSDGFYLFYQNAVSKDLPQSIFKDEEAELQFLVQFPAGDPFFGWHNAFTVASAGIKDSLYIGGTDQQGNQLMDYQPTYPAGCFTFDLVSPHDLLADTEDGNQPYSPETIAQLYHLIQYEIPKDDAQGILGSKWSPAIGPSSSQQNSLGAISQADAPPEITTANESYRQVVPFYNFVQNGKPPQEGELPNLYATIGKKTTVNFRLTDVYGNNLSPMVSPPSTTSLYNDLLKSVAEWPGVHVAYSITTDKGSKPVMALELQFNPKQVIRSFENNSYVVESMQLGASFQEQEDSKQQAQIALFKLALIQLQLDDPNTHFRVSTTLFQSTCETGNKGKVVAEDNILKEPLQKFAGSIKAEIEKVLSGGTPQKQALNIKVPIDPAEVAEVPCDIIPLNVWWDIYRDKWLPENVDLLPKVKENSFQVKPNLVVPESQQQNSGEESSGEATLIQFAKSLEQAFTGFDGQDGQLKVASRTGNPDFSAAGEATYLWVVKWSKTKGIHLNWQAGAFTYFTLSPLSNELLPSLSFNVTTYNDDLEPSTSKHTYSDVDIDAFARRFLIAMDEILDPEIASAIAKAVGNGEEYNNIMKAKAELAKWITQGLIPVFEGQSGNIESAKDHFEQALLGRLIRAYDTSAIAQIPFEVTVNGQPEGGENTFPRLFGSVAPPEPAIIGQEVAARQADQSFTLGNGKMKLNAADGHTEASYLNFLATAKNPSEQADLQVNLLYNPVFLEHLIDSEEKDFGYIPSSWLRFIITGKDTPTQYELGTADIPIPLRAFPDNPVLRSQQAKAFRTQEESLALNNNPIEDALKWNYISEVFREDIAAQDELWFDLTYNLPVKSLAGQDPNSLLTQELPPLQYLFQQLALFEAAYDSLRALLLSEVKSIFEGGQTGTLKSITGILAPLIQQVADAYERLMNADEEVFAETEVETRHFVMSFKEVFKDPPILKLFGDSPDIAEFPFSINQQTYASGTQPKKVTQNPPDHLRTWYEVDYPYKPDAKEPGKLTIQWNQIDSIIRQTAITDFWILRNADLGDGREKVNPKLIYETPVIAFANPVLPLFTVSDIEVTSQADIEKTLSSIFSPFAQAGTASTQNRLLKAEASYSYNLLNFGDSQTEALFVPTATRLNFDLNLKPQNGNPDDPATSLEEYSKAMSKNLQAWHEENKPLNRPNGLKSRVHFNITLFAVIDNSQLPLIRVKNIYTNIPDENWWNVSED